MTKTKLNFFGIPCSNLKHLLKGDELPCTSEQEAFSIAFGASLTGASSTVYMQNTGFATCINVIISLFKTYEVPYPHLIISNRTKPIYHSNVAIYLYHFLALLKYDNVEVIQE